MVFCRRRLHSNWRTGIQIDCIHFGYVYYIVYRIRTSFRNNMVREYRWNCISRNDNKFHIRRDLHISSQRQLFLLREPHFRIHNYERIRQLHRKRSWYQHRGEIQSQQRWDIVYRCWYHRRSRSGCSNRCCSIRA